MYSALPAPVIETRTMSSSYIYHPLNVDDALKFLDVIKVRFQERPVVYNAFLDVMKDFKMGRYRQNYGMRLTLASILWVWWKVYPIYFAVISTFLIRLKHSCRLAIALSAPIPRTRILSLWSYHDKITVNSLCQRRRQPRLQRSFQRTRVQHLVKLLPSHKRRGRLVSIMHVYASELTT